MKKTLLLTTVLSLYFSLTAFSQGIAPVENWNDYFIYNSPNNPNPDNIVNYNSTSFICYDSVAVRVDWVIDPQDQDPNTQFQDWDEISHFEINFDFFDPVLGDWVQDTMQVEKSEFEHVNANGNYGDHKHFSDNISFDYISNLSQSGLVRYLNIRLVAKVPINGTSIFETLYPTATSQGWKTVEFCEVREDSDGDSIFDDIDNCPSISNENQEDSDNDGVGNVCDNCPNTSNSNQANNDNDNLGNACDDDDDNDGILDNVDNCQYSYNPDQADSDNDGLGDVCDDVDNNAEPNLTLGGYSVTVDGTTYDAEVQLPIFKKGAEHIFNITIENNDEGLAEDVSFRLFVSTSIDAYPDIGSIPVYQYYNNVNPVGDISGNTEETYQFTEYIYESISSLQLNENTDYFMFVHVDYDMDIDESDESDFDNVIPVRFRWDDPDTAGRIALLNIGNGTIEVPLDNGGGVVGFGTKPLEPIFNLKIYTLLNAGTPLINQNVVNNQTIDVSNLGVGVYVVHINDSYIKKFKKTSVEKK